MSANTDCLFPNAIAMMRTRHKLIAWFARNRLEKEPISKEIEEELRQEELEMYRIYQAEPRQ